MGIEGINRWVWIAIGAVVGLLFFAVHQAASEDWKGHGQLLSQRQFHVQSVPLTQKGLELIGISKGIY